MTSRYQPPDRITIPAPLPTIRQRGIHATGETYGRNIKVRVSVSERQMIEKIAGCLDMSIASFIRWCSVKVAEEITDDISKGNNSD